MTNERRRKIDVVDTTDTLTVEEVHELKRIASASKASRYMLALLIGVVTIVGFDKAFDFVQRLFNH